MADVNLPLRMALDDLRKAIEPDDIEEQVRVHAQSAYTLAQMERRPPGYSVEDWAVYLMDLPPHALRDRLQQRIDREESENDRHLDLHSMIERPDTVLPTLPRTVPPGVMAKMKNRRLKLYAAMVSREVTSALVPFIGPPRKRSKAAFSAAAQAVRAKVQELTQRVGCELPVRVKLKMAEDGQFYFDLVSTEAP